MLSLQSGPPLTSKSIGVKSGSILRGRYPWLILLTFKVPIHLIITRYPVLWSLPIPFSFVLHSAVGYLWPELEIPVTSYLCYDRRYWVKRGKEQNSSDTRIVNKVRIKIAKQTVYFRHVVFTVEPLFGCNSAIHINDTLDLQ